MYFTMLMLSVFRGKGLFFSDRLIDAIQDAGIVGLHVDDTEMEMNP
ncbi:Uncharacterised protein [Salmonella enterica subsp. enterica]|uniref:Uncharacterized protein n=1 Tax=Salmonella enterica I TaxID=59201 RepID=A0A3S4IXH6_SALET|nr:Uncharacterised protein [Salmonella enterica subsp. enterica]